MSESQQKQEIIDSCRQIVNTEVIKEYKTDMFSILKGKKAN
jgi:hypothetical protein